MELHQLLAITIGMYLQCIVNVNGIDYHCLSVSESGRCKECYIGWHGDNCDKMCQHCDTGGCNKTTGVCLQCQAGYYSTNCSMTCPSQCRESYDDSVFCDRTTGNCLEGCRPKWWGGKCEHKCGKQCTDSVCFFYDGSCAFGCKDGVLTGIHCDKTCSVGCLHGNCSQLAGVCLHGCKTGFYGNSCDKNCTDKCLDKDCSTAIDEETPTCIRGCIPGWKPPLCDSPCHPNCLSCTEAGMCTSCKAGFTGTSCEKKKCNCLGSGCSDDRLCDGCPDGWWGQTCELACSQNCLRCQQKSGKCTTCRQGFTYDGRSQCTSMIDGNGTSKSTVTDVPTQRQESHVPIVIISTIACLLVIAVLIGISIRFRGRILSCIKHAPDENAPDNEEPESSTTDLLAQDREQQEDV
ncbi:multiple epidermal growth factor-like domains protein 6 isoform X1 [Haliotis rufescens]|uniref:multiple epidermal growth factor-like domains protein 6 isoform X1 n=1 Tax=Haliotis rufescens TaxID=6454 RepID=UPI00201E8B81|nr:multiple epidermal growth factor-like domains protein 6 isoform X1 [Haliotis rufescens]